MRSVLGKIAATIPRIASGAIKLQTKLGLASTTLRGGNMFKVAFSETSSYRCEPQGVLHEVWAATACANS